MSIKIWNLLQLVCFFCIDITWSGTRAFITLSCLNHTKTGRVTCQFIIAECAPLQGLGQDIYDWLSIFSILKSDNKSRSKSCDKTVLFAHKCICCKKKNGIQRHQTEQTFLTVMFETSPKSKRRLLLKHTVP